VVLRRRYGCTEYCQDPTLVKDEDEGQACSDCITNSATPDAQACQQCMIATKGLEGTDRTDRRAECFTWGEGRWDWEGGCLTFSPPHCCCCCWWYAPSCATIRFRPSRSLDALLPPPSLDACRSIEEGG
jgi:hypothetical protein